MLFMGGGVPGLPFTFEGPTARTEASWAGFLDEEEMKAAFAIRSGCSAVAGLAVHVGVSFLAPFARSVSGVCVPRRAIAVACRVVANIAADV